MNFKLFNLNPQIEEGIKSLGYEIPTPIQSQAIPLILKNRDIIGQAQTGTGKTAAFILPILQRLTERQGRHVRALILSPTRELAEQTHQAASQMGRRTKLRSVAVYGGVSPNVQIGRLHNGAEIVVACPGRLLDLVDQKAIDLTRIEVLVIDEADRMFDMGFLPDIRRILKRLPGDRQTLLFSATMPEEILRLAEGITRRPVRVKVDEAVPAASVCQAVYPVEQHLKAALLLKVLDSVEMQSVLVFTRTKARADRLTKHVKKSGFPVAALHGDLSQNKRQGAITGFGSGKYQVLVATDIAARGIDISNISHVINYDMPDTVDAYTHRIGRTGRAAQTGTALTFATRSERGFVLAIEKVLGEPLEKRLLEGFDYLVPSPEPSAARPAGRIRNVGQPHSASGKRLSTGPRRGGKDLSQFPGYRSVSKRSSAA